MIGYDIQRYIYFTTVVLPKAKIVLTTNGESIILKKGKECLGSFSNLENAIQFVNGYLYAMSKNFK